MPNPGLRQQPRGTMGGVTVQTSDCHADLKVHRDIHELSFEAGETTTLKVYCPQACQVTAMNGQVTKALAGTDAGTVALVDSSGTTQSTLSFPASSALTTEGNANPTPFNVAAGSFYRLTWQKATAGGKCVVQVTTVRNGNG